jgi:hypothetical protein
MGLRPHLLQCIDALHVHGIHCSWQRALTPSAGPGTTVSNAQAFELGVAKDNQSGKAQYTQMLVHQCFLC